MTSSVSSTVSGSAVMWSPTRAARGSAAPAANRTRSRSVMMPIGRFPRTTTIDPTRREYMSAAASATLAPTSVVSTERLMMSPTVRARVGSVLAMLVILAQLSAAVDRVPARYISSRHATPRSGHAPDYVPRATGLRAHAARGHPGRGRHDPGGGSPADHARRHGRGRRGEPRHRQHRGDRPRHGGLAEGAGGAALRVPGHGQPW